MIRGRLEPPLLFTQTFVEKHKAIVRGLFSAVTVPTPVYPLLQQYRFHDSLFFCFIFFLFYYYFFKLFLLFLFLNIILNYLNFILYFNFNYFKINKK